MEYNDRGEAAKLFDPADTENQQEFDDAGRRTKLVENYVSSGTGMDENKETQYRYNADGFMDQLTAINSRTGNQVTDFGYGTATGDQIQRNDLLRYKQFPTASSSERVYFWYNRQSEVREVEDQAQTERMLDYDKLGRLIHDRATSLASGVDGTVRRISRTYNSRGLLEKISSYSDATVGNGSIVNEVKNEYDGFGLLIKHWQSHSGAVGGSTPLVEYAYTNGSSNHARRTSITYPNSTVIDLNYGTTGLADDVLNRVKQLKESSTVLVDYSYLGIKQRVIGNYSGQPGVELTYYSSGSTGDAGDQYVGLDRFGRVVDQRWRKTSDDSDVDRVKFGFDRMGNRQWRENDSPSASEMDEYYIYDGLNRLINLQRGNLTGNPPTGISGTPTWQEEYTLDPTGNFGVGVAGGDDSAYVATEVDGSSTTIYTDQKRANNAANEITNITDSESPTWPTPTNNIAGYITAGPQPLSPGSSYDYIWDAWKRLVEVKVTSGSSVATYKYDGLNRRVTLNDGTDTRHFYYSDRWQILEERLNELTSADRWYVWGRQYVDELILRDDGTDRYYALNDKWNITAIIDTSANVEERYAYQGYGAVQYMDDVFLPISASTVGWETLFAGYRYNEDTGLYLARNRYLHAALGRWLSRDPIGYQAGSNLNFYTGNNPINRVDPSGNEPIPEDVQQYIEDYQDAYGKDELPWVGWWDTHHNEPKLGASWWNIPEDQRERYGLVWNPKWVTMDEPGAPGGMEGGDSTGENLREGANIDDAGPSARIVLESFLGIGTGLLGAYVGWAAATTGVGAPFGVALALNSSFQVGANTANLYNGLFGNDSGPTGPLHSASMLISQNQDFQRFSQVGDHLVNLSLGRIAVPNWSRLPSIPMGRAGTIGSTVSRVPGSPIAKYPALRAFEFGNAGFSVYHSWSWTWESSGSTINQNAPPSRISFP